MLSTFLVSLLGAMGLATLTVQPRDEDVTDRPEAPDSEIAGAVDPIEGTNWQEELYGTEGDDWIAGARGFDTQFGNDGDDTLMGEEGRDLLEGGAGDDLLDGGAWHDALDGEAGDDTMLGGAGMDTLLGGAGDDSLDGGAWNDLLIGGTGADVLEGGAGDDILFGNTPQDGLTAAAFHNGLEAIWEDAEAWAGLTPEEQTDLAQQVLAQIFDQTAPLPDADAPDTLIVGDGDDTIFVGEGDIATGGDGADHFYVGNWVGTGAEITDFREEDYLTVTYDASTGAVPPVITVETLENGDQIVLADGSEVALLVQPETPATVDRIEIVGLFTTA